MAEFLSSMVEALGSIPSNKIGTNSLTCILNQRIILLYFELLLIILHEALNVLFSFLTCDKMHVIVLRKKVEFGSWLQRFSSLCPDAVVTMDAVWVPGRETEKRRGSGFNIGFKALPQKT